MQFFDYGNGLRNDGCRTCGFGCGGYRNKKKNE